MLLGASLPTCSINDAAARCHREDTARLAIYVERSTSASQTFASWNQIVEWLRGIDTLRTGPDRTVHRPSFAPRRRLSVAAASPLPSSIDGVARARRRISSADPLDQLLR